ncbi:MAG: alpha-E domain-containing protein [Pseudomonadota bacterium]
MLSRFAENAFWMGRYAERAENLSRLLLMTEIFAGGEDSDKAWRPVLQVFFDEDAYMQRYKTITALNVVKFYLCEANNPNSVYAAVHMLKENARSLRHIISTESWRQISVFFSDVQALSKRRLSLSELSDICSDIRTACFTHRGVIEGTWYRDEVWRFNRLGSALERADQMTRLIDMKYFEYDRDDDENVAPPDVAWWNTLLRSASGFHAFQRKHPVDPDPADAARFLLLDTQLPLSVRGAVRAVAYQLDRLHGDFNVEPDKAIGEALSALEARLETPPERLNGRALHVYLDHLQIEILALANAIGARYFSPSA